MSLLRNIKYTKSHLSQEVTWIEGSWSVDDSRRGCWVCLSCSYSLLCIFPWQPLLEARCWWGSVLGLVWIKEDVSLELFSILLNISNFIWLEERTGRKIWIADTKINIPTYAFHYEILWDPLTRTKLFVRLHVIHWCILVAGSVNSLVGA